MERGFYTGKVREREIKKAEERNQQQREESRWEAMKEKHKGKDDKKRNKQTGGMRIERDKSEEEERKCRGIERLRLHVCWVACWLALNSSCLCAHTHFHTSAICCAWRENEKRGWQGTSEQ